ncbi:MAG: hypothetical protein PVJ76_02795 [Gemmatimonadota bacterium]|jgi:hypothetical protein
MLAPTARRGESSLKKDIFAVITFVATGFLFYLIQTHDPAEHQSEKVSDAVEQLSAQETGMESPAGLSLKEGEGRDS